MRWCVALLVLATGACGDDSGGGGDAATLPDAARIDAATDAPIVDAAVDAPTDAPLVDASPDAPVIDASPDAAPPDAPPDAGTPTIATPCGTPIQPTGEILMDTGVDKVVSLWRSGNRVLAGGWRRWALFDATTRSIVAAEDAALWKGGGDMYPYPVILRGNTMLLQSAGWIQLRDATTAQVLANIPTTAEHDRVGLAVDGSYAWAVTTTSLRAWSRSGTLLVDRAGNYSNTYDYIFAAPEELRIPRGPAGSQVIELVSTADNTSTVTPAFVGGFYKWFADGERFLTGIVTDLRIYTKSGALVLVFQPPPSNGLLLAHDDYLAYGHMSPSNEFSVSIYRIAETTPIASFALGFLGSAVASGPMLMLRPYGSNDVDQFFEVVDLTGPAVISTRYETPPRAPRYFAAEASAWSVSFGDAAISDRQSGSLLPLTCGKVRAVAGSASGKLALATEAGLILYLDVSGGTRTVTTAVPFTSWKVEMSSDGAVLAANGDQAQDGQPVRAYQMPAGNVTAEWVSPSSWPYDFSLASSGARIGRGIEYDGDFYVTDLTGTTTYMSVLDRELYGPMLLTPSGVHAALNDLNYVRAYIWENATPIGIANGVAYGWIDNDRLLVDRFGWVGSDYVPIATDICDPSGAVITTLPQTIPFPFSSSSPPSLRWFSMVSPTQIFVPRTARIYSLTDGSVVWSSAYPAGFPLFPADVAAGQVVRSIGPLVTIESPP